MKTVKVLLELIKSVYPLRTCTYDLSKDKIAMGKYKTCLEYHLGNCMGPCEDLQNVGEYDKQIDDIRELVKGNFKSSLQYFRKEMKSLASNMKFEEAQRIKELLSA